MKLPGDAVLLLENVGCCWRGLKGTYWVPFPRALWMNVPSAQRENINDRFKEKKKVLPESTLVRRWFSQATLRTVGDTLHLFPAISYQGLLSAYQSEVVPCRSEGRRAMCIEVSSPACTGSHPLFLGSLPVRTSEEIIDVWCHPQRMTPESHPSTISSPCHWSSSHSLHAQPARSYMLYEPPVGPEVISFSFCMQQQSE